MAERVQNYKNHPRLLPPYHFFVVPVLLVNALNELRHIWLDPSRHFVWTFIVATALLMLAVLARVMPLTVQDRVIRIEMRQRLAASLPPDLRGRIDDLTPRQLVALRFAGDGELAELVRDVLDGKLATSKAIKLRVKEWRADWLRA